METAYTISSACNEAISKAESQQRLVAIRAWDKLGVRMCLAAITTTKILPCAIAWIDGNDMPFCHDKPYSHAVSGVLLLENIRRQHQPLSERFLTLLVNIPSDLKLQLEIDIRLEKRRGRQGYAV